MARAPGSGKPRALIKSPVPLVKGALILGVVGSTLGASLLVASVTGAAHVALPSLAGPSYARDVAGFHRLSGSLNKEIVNTPSPAPVPTVRPTPLPPSAKPIDSQTPETPGTPNPSQPPVPHTPPPSLSVAIAANTARTHPNKNITFTITITNNGPGVAKDLVVESDVPDGATLVSWMCNGALVNANGADHFRCGSLGSAPAPNHALVWAAPALAQGATITQTFTVQVDHNVSHNSAIVDRAHTYAANADLADSNEASVIVK